MCEYMDRCDVDALSLLLIRKNKEEITAAWSFLGSSAAKESSCNAGDPGLIPGSGRSPGEGIGYSLQYSWAP